MVEAALISPVFILLLFGLIEYGGAFRDYLTAANASAGGARMAAIKGNDATADWEILQAVKAQAAAVPLDQIDMVVIFKAQDANSSVPANCKIASQSVGTTADPGFGACNRYAGSDLRLESMPVAWGNCSGSSPTRSYCASGRKTAVNAVQPSGPSGPDYLGVYIQLRHPFVTGMFGSDLTMSNTTIIKLEPQRIQ